MAVDAHANFGFGIVTVAPSPRDTGTSLSVSSTDGATFPAVSFNAVAWPPGLPFPLSSNAEIVRVTANASGAFTITRAQESTTAKPIDVGWQIANAATNKVFTDIEAALNPTGTINAYGGRTAPTNWLGCDGTAVSRATYAALFAVIAPTVGTFTVTIATPAVVSLTAHGFVTGDQVYLTTTGALPTGLTANTIYFVIKIDANSFNLATTLANAIAATKIATSGTQSGTHTTVACPFGLGDGSTTFNVPDLRGRTVAGADAMMGASAASRLTLAQTGGAYGTVGAAGGEQGHTLTSGEAPNMNMDVQRTGGGSATALSANASGNTGWSTELVRFSGGGGAHNTVQPTVVANYIIKT